MTNAIEQGLAYHYRTYIPNRRSHYAVIEKLVKAKGGATRLVALHNNRRIVSVTLPTDDLAVLNYLNGVIDALDALCENEKGK